MRFYSPADFSLKYKKSLRDFINNQNFKCPYSITLTMKQSTRFEKLDEIKSAIELKYFLNRLNYKIFKNNFRRKNKKIKVVPVLEKNKNERLHYHLLIDLPPEVHELSLEHMIEKIRKKTQFFDSQFFIKKQTASIFHFSSYTTKMKNENIVDFLNMNI